MNIEKKLEGDTLTLKVAGRLDTNTTPQLESELKSELAGVETLVMDFEKLEYISSAGLRVLLSTQKKMNVQGALKISHVGEAVMEIFEVTGFSDILTIIA